GGLAAGVRVHGPDAVGVTGAQRVHVVGHVERGIEADGDDHRAAQRLTSAPPSARQASTAAPNRPARGPSGERSMRGAARQANRSSTARRNGSSNASPASDSPPPITTTAGSATIVVV